MNAKVMLLLAIMALMSAYVIVPAMAGFDMNTCDGDTTADECRSCCESHFGAGTLIDHIGLPEYCGCFA